MIEFAWDIGELVTGFWRFSFSAAYRARKLDGWRDDWRTLGGRLATIAEVLGMVLFGVGLPAFVIAFVVVNV